MAREIESRGRGRGIRRSLSVAKNLDSLPLYRMMLSLNEQASVDSEEDAVFV